MSIVAMPTMQLIALLRRIGAISDTRPLRLALEPRVVFDAAGTAMAAEVVTATAESHASPTPAETAAAAASSEAIELAQALSTSDPATPANSIVFIDQAVTDPGTLANAIQPDSEIVFLTGDRDGLEQIATYLQGRTGIGAIHILSHGEAGELRLGSSTVTTQSIAGEHADELATIRGVLSANADILIYGCDVAAGASGQNFVAALADATGADVAASTDGTGAARLGGDWHLETHTGQIEAGAIDVPEWGSLLAPLSVTPAGTGGVTAMTVAQQLMGDNVTIVSATLYGQSNQAGIFSGATGYSPSWLSFDSGVIFSTGHASLPTSNTSSGYTAGLSTFGVGGQSDFAAIGGGGSHNASYIDITFVPTTERIAIQFVFGSDEYNEFVYSGFADAIAIWVNGSNIAVTPTGTPISIDTINQSGTFTPGAGSSAAPSLYVNNASGTYATEMDGFTRTLGASITVTPNVTNTIRLGISDIGDGAYDSWMLVKADSVQAKLIAQNDIVGTTLNTPITFDVLANDIDYNGDAKTVVSIADQPVSAGQTITLASGATVTLDANGTLTVTPALNSSTQELFTYTVTDSLGNTATAYAAVNIVSGTPPALDLDASASGTGHATSYTVGGAGASVANSDATLTDTNNITRATIGISGSFDGDLLTVGALPAGVTVDPSSTATSIVLVGNVAPATMATAIKAVTYSNSSTTPDTTDRVISVQVTDSTGLSSAIANTTVNINTVPVATADGPVAVVPGVGKTIDVLANDTDADGDTLTVTHINGTSIAVGGSVTLSSGTEVRRNADGTLTIVMLPGATAAESFTYTVSDGNGGTDSSTLQLTITPVSDAPAGTDATLMVIEDGAHTFSAADFGFTDPNDLPADSFAAVIITSLPASGTLKLGGVDVTAGQVIAVADIPNLVFAPAANANGTAYASLTFQVQDDGGTANGGVDLDPTPKTITFDVTPVSDAPAGADATLPVLEDGAHTFTAADFGFSDPDGDSLESVKITSLPGAGTLLLSGVAVSVGDLIAAADIAAGRLTYVPAPGTFGVSYASFQFQVIDDSTVSLFRETFGADSGRSSFASAGLPGTTTYGYDPVGTIGDGEYALVSALDSSLGNWWNTVDFSSNDFTQTDHTGDVDGRWLLVNASHGAGEFYRQSVSIAQTGDYQVSVALSNANAFPIKPDVTISIFDAGNNLVATTNTGNLPDYAGANNWQTFSLTATLAPGSYTFALVNNAPGGFGNDLYVDDIVFATAPPNSDPTPKTVTFDVTPVNDAPSGTDATLTVIEDGAHTFTAADFGFTDANDTPADSLAAVIITSLPASGTLKLSGVDVTAGQVIAVADIPNLVFAPAVNGHGTAYASLTFQVQDDGGTANGGVDLDPTPKTITFDITPVSDAPAGTDATLMVIEDGAHTFSAADFGFTDPNDLPADSLAAVIITSLPASGTLKLGGVDVTAGQVIAVADIPNLVFAPAANANGTAYASLTFQVQDDGGTANGGADLDATPKTITFDVTPVNEAPVNTMPGALSLNEDIGTAITGISIADIDGDTVTTVLSVSNGVLSVASGSGAVVTGGGTGTVTLTGTTAQINTALAGLVYLGNANTNGSDTLTITTNDPGGLFDTDTVAITVEPVNDAPAGTNVTLTVLEDGSHTFSLANFGFNDPNDTPANVLQSVKITTLPVIGSLTLGGVAVTLNQVIAAADIPNLVFTPDANTDGTGYASIGFQVTDDGGTVYGGQNTDATPNTITFNVTSVNDAPAGTDGSVSILDNQTYTFSAASFGFTDPVDVPANTLASVMITSLPASGTLRLSGVAVTVNQVITAANIPNLVYTPAANSSGTFDIDFRVRDNGGTANGGINTDPTANTFTITVGYSNTAPTNALPALITALEDVPTAISGVSIDDIQGGAITTILSVSHGTLVVAGGSGATVTGDGSATVTLVGTVVQINAALSGLTYTSDLNYHGGDTLTITTTDSGPLSDMDTVAIAVTSINDAPAGVDATLTVLEDGSHTFTAADFGLIDASDSPADSLLSVVITATPASGTLKLNGIDVTAGQVIAVADIPNLVFAPAINANGTAYASLTYQVQDSGGTANGGVDLDASPNTITFDVTPVNDAPVARNDALSTSEDASVLGDLLADNGSGADNDVDSDPVFVTRVASGSSVALLSGLIDGTGIGGPIAGSDGGTFTVAATGAITFNPGSDFQDLDTGESRTTSIVYQVDDGHGGISTAVATITVTGITEPVAIGTAVQNANGTLVVSGTGEPGASVEITFPDGSNASGIVATDGTFFVTSPVPQTTGTVTVTQTDSQSNVDTESATFTDTSAPLAPSIAAIGQNPNGTLTVSGTGEPGSTVSVTFPDGSTGTAEVQPDGTYTVTSSAPQTTGDVTATQTDDAGNASPPSSMGFTDTQAPVAPAIAAIGQNPNGTLTVSGTGEPGSTVSVTFPDGSTGTAEVQPDGTYTVTSSAPQTTGDVTATQTDDAGNASPPVSAYLISRYDPHAILHNAQHHAQGAPIANYATIADVIGNDGITTYPALLEASILMTQAWSDNQSRSTELLSAGMHWPTPLYTGYLQFGIGDGMNAGSEPGHIRMEAHIKNGILTVLLQDDFRTGTAHVTGYQITLIDGRSLPAWLDQPSPDMLYGLVPANAAPLDVRLEVMLSNGRTHVQNFQLDPVTGMVKPLASNRADLPPVFSDQLRMFAELGDTAADDLAKAITAAGAAP